MRRQRAIEAVLVLVVFALMNLANAVFQKPITYNDGKGFDGVVYYRVAELISEGRLPLASAPFVYRIGTPLLVALLFKSDLLWGFKVVNITANALATTLLVIWLRGYLREWKVRLALVVLFLTQWHAPIRSVYYYPAYTDPWLFVFVLGGLIFIRQYQEKPTIRTLCALALMALVGSVFREASLLVPVAFLFSNNPLRPWGGTMSSAGRLKPVQFIPLLMGLAGIAAVHVVASQDNDYSFIGTALTWIYAKPLPTYLLGSFSAFGPIIFIVIYNWRLLISFLLEREFALIYLACGAILAWVGGTDTERMLYWSMPIVYVLIGITLEDKTSLMKSPLLVAVLVISQAIAQRIFWPIPDFPGTATSTWPLLTPFGDKVPYLDLLSVQGNHLVELISLIQYLGLGAVLLEWLRHRERTLTPATRLSPSALSSDGGAKVI